MKLQVGQRVAIYSKNGRVEKRIVQISRHDKTFLACRDFSGDTPLDTKLHHFNEAYYIDPNGKEHCIRCDCKYDVKPEHQLKSEKQQVIAATHAIVNEFVSVFSKVAIEVIVNQALVRK